MPAVHVTSDIGPLRSVLVHTPGNELLAVTPGTREDYLYDDIINLETAQREHRRLVAVLERFAELPTDQLVALLVEGAAEEAGPIGRALNEVGFVLPPLPNLFFTRDVGIVIGDHVGIGSMG